MFLLDAHPSILAPARAQVTGKKRGKFPAETPSKFEAGFGSERTTLIRALEVLESNGAGEELGEQLARSMNSLEEGNILIDLES